MWFSESQLPRTRPRFGPITSAGETRFGSFLTGIVYKKFFRPDFGFRRTYFNYCNVISGIRQSWLWKSRGRSFFKSRATFSGILRPGDANSGARVQERVRRKKRVYRVLIQLICEITFFAQDKMNRCASRQTKRKTFCFLVPVPFYLPARFCEKARWPEISLRTCAHRDFT